MNKVWKDGDPWIWLTGGALAASLLMVIGLVALIMISGLGLFWPQEIVRLKLTDGGAILGQVTGREPIPKSDRKNERHSKYRLQIKQGNREPDLYGTDFIWVDEARIVSRETPREAIVIERLEWGNLYGRLQEIRVGTETVARGPEECWALLETRLPDAHQVQEEIKRIEQDDIGSVNYVEEKNRLKLKALELKGVREGALIDLLKRETLALQEQYKILQAKLAKLRASQTAIAIVSVERGKEKALPLSEIVRAYRPNALGLFGKAGIYISKFWEFLWDDPRESNTEGGVFPAIFGTVMMVLVMSIFVTPLGVLTALYLREYAKVGKFVSLVRIAVNNLAGVPSIVFGVFGVGFLICTVGGGIDRFFFPEALPAPTFGTGGILWASLTLALLTVPVVIVATEEGLASIPKGLREASLALGATKWETTWKVVLPSLMPSILTGLILAMARAAGEVAPLMITGVVKLAPSLPLDGTPPYIHLDRKFMHLGFHIYDVGFQSPNVDASRPMVFATAFLLLVIVVLLNLAAIVLRKRLRKRFAGSAL